MWITFVLPACSPLRKPAAAVPSSAPQILLWVLIGLLILLCTIAAWIPPMIALQAQHLSVTRKISSFVVLALLGCGVSLSNTIEAGKALFTNRTWAFQQNPQICHPAYPGRLARQEISGLPGLCRLSGSRLCVPGRGLDRLFHHTCKSGRPFDPRPLYGCLCLCLNPHHSGEPPRKRQLIWVLTGISPFASC